MTLVALATAVMLSAALQAAEPDNAIDPAVVEARKPWPGVVPTDLEIANQLRAVLKQEPDRVICLSIARAGSRMPHEACRTLRGCYDFETDRDAASDVRDVLAIIERGPPGGDEVGARVGPPPPELIEIIKDRYRSPTARARAVQRAKARLNPAPRSSAPSTSNP